MRGGGSPIAVRKRANLIEAKALLADAPQRRPNASYIV
jgi:hypothetical protein